jgi:hypothetical protein
MSNSVGGKAFRLSEEKLQLYLLTRPMLICSRHEKVDCFLDRKYRFALGPYSRPAMAAISE